MFEFDKTALLFFKRGSNYTKIQLFLTFPSILVHCDSGFVQIVLDFFQILMVVHRVHCCEASSSWDQSTFNDGVQYISVPDVVDVLSEVIQQQYIVVQCRINEITS